VHYIEYEISTGPVLHSAESEYRLTAGKSNGDPYSFNTSGFSIIEKKKLERILRDSCFNIHETENAKLFLLRIRVEI